MQHLLLCQKLIDQTNHSISKKPNRPVSFFIQDPRKTKGKKSSINQLLPIQEPIEKPKPDLKQTLSGFDIQKKTPFFYPSILLNRIQSFESRPSVQDS